MAGADVQIGNQSIPEAFGLTDKMIATIKRWAADAKILGKEVKLLPPGSSLEGLGKEALKDTVVLTPTMKFIMRILYPPGDPEPYTTWCDFPKGSDHFILQFRRYVGEQHEAKVTNNPNLRRQFILEILKQASVTGLDRHFLLGGRKAFYWQFCDAVYYDGLTKDRFFQRYRTLGATGNYLHAYFANLFLKNDAGKNNAEKKADSHLYL